jgi:prolyl-tRNA synthetase
MEKKDKYSKLLIKGKLFFYGATKGSFILPPHGYALWKNIQNILDKKLAARGVQNVLLPTLIPLNLLEKEQEHVAGFSPECFYIEKIGEKKIEIPLVLRPTSEVLFYEWYRQILQSYQDLPFLYNQWCSVFRAEKNTNPFFRNTEFLWQEGHTLHSSAEEARQFALNILSDYQDYAENILNLAVIVGKKTEREKFAGALETYTVECLLPDGQCLQLATSHYFGDNFCRLMEVKFQGSDPNKKPIQYPFSTSWGTSTRALGALVKTHEDEWGVILPFEIAPIQIAFILIGKSEELISYRQEIYNLLSPHYRCRLYDKHRQVNTNFSQADEEGCPFKIILGPEELKNKEITLVRRDNIERRITISLASNEAEQKIFAIFEKFAQELMETQEKEETKKELEKAMAANSYQRGQKAGKIFNVIRKEKEEFHDSHTYKIDSFSELEIKIKGGAIGLFLIPFCNQLDCEIKIKEKVPSYSIRCIKELILSEKKKAFGLKKCLFCERLAENMVYLGRSY